jgi:hypothetical protein
MAKSGVGVLAAGILRPDMMIRSPFVPSHPTRLFPMNDARQSSFASAFMTLSKAEEWG